MSILILLLLFLFFNLLHSSFIKNRVIYALYSTDEIYDLDDEQTSQLYYIVFYISPPPPPPPARRTYLLTLGLRRAGYGGL